MYLVAIHSLLPCLLCFTILKLSQSLDECQGSVLAHKCICDSVKQCWTADAEELRVTKEKCSCLKEDDKLQGLHLLQLGAHQIAHRPCPMPDLQKFEVVGKGCSEIEGCLHGNHGYHHLEKAWKVCGHTAYCGAVLQASDGKFYLRRANDPNEQIAGVKLYKFSCLAGEIGNEAKGLPPDEFSRNSEAKQVAKWKRIENRIHEERAMVKKHSLLPPEQEFGGQGDDLTESDAKYAEVAEQQAALHEQRQAEELAREQAQREDEAYEAEYAALGTELEDGEKHAREQQDNDAEKQQDNEQNTVPHDLSARVKVHETAEWQRIEEKIMEENAIVRQHSLLPPEQEAAELARLEEEKQIAEADGQQLEEDEEHAETDVRIVEADAEKKLRTKADTTSTDKKPTERAEKPKLYSIREAQSSQSRHPKSLEKKHMAKESRESQEPPLRSARGVVDETPGFDVSQSSDYVILEMLKFEKVPKTLEIRGKVCDVKNEGTDEEPKFMARHLDLQSACKVETAVVKFEDGSEEKLKIDIERVY